jgi:hypothetical protein
MKIRVPRWLVAAWNAFGNWANVTVYERGRIEIRSIDVLLAVLFFAVTGYYYWTSSWYGAVTGGLMYIFVALIALWFF